MADAKSKTKTEKTPLLQKMEDEEDATPLLGTGKGGGGLDITTGCCAYWYHSFF